MASEFERQLEKGLQDNSEQEISQNELTDEQIIKEIEADNEKEYLKEIGKKNKGFLVDLTTFEKERVARFIKRRIEEALPKHEELEDNYEEYDEVYRMERKELEGDSSDMPNYRSPITTVTTDVIHANIMNVFFTPKDVMRVLPTEAGDVGKVNKLSTFGNWSMDNEMKIFENVDRLFHSSTKNGESPYLVHWVREYGVEIERKIVPNPADLREPLFDPDTKEPLFQEVEKPKLLYSGPKLEVFSRRDYIQPDNAIMDKVPDWEAMRKRISLDEFQRDELEGKIYNGTAEDISDWAGNTNSELEDYEGDEIPLGAYTKEFYLWFGRLRINVIKRGDGDNPEDQFEELEDEFIALINYEDEVLCSLRRNKFPQKKRPIGVDYFITDDEGRRAGLGVAAHMSSLQKSYDSLWNQFILGVVQSNSPIAFFDPTGNKRKEPIKMKNGYMYPTSNPNSVKLFQFPQPNEQMINGLQLIDKWTQLLFGISSFSAGVESTLDPDAPAKKAELIVAQGNVRLNAIIKRKNKTLRDIFERWFLLYKENMPPNKFMRVAGDSKENPWQFNPISIADFALKSMPDFELTGNVLNSNKTLEAQKSIAIYQLLVRNPFFTPQTSQGQKSLFQLTKWLIDKLDETGLSGFLPSVPGDSVNTPEEENARFLQGDIGDPEDGEDHIQHIRTHKDFINDPSIPEEIRLNVAQHIKQHIEKIQTQIAAQQVMGDQGGGTQPGAQGTNPNGILQGGGVASPQAGAQGPAPRQV
jgi:hypothetical protein